jgi:hypothetical protein
VPVSWFENLEDSNPDDLANFDEWWEPDLASIRNGRLPQKIPKGFVQPLAKTLVMGGP